MNQAEHRDDLNKATALLDGDTRRNGQASKLFIETPTVYSHALSRLAGFHVFLKLENLQPPGSFKLRGISHMIQKAVQKGKCHHVYCASGGNAGMAATHASKQLGVACTIILPETTPAFVANKLQGMGAEVKIHGPVYDVAKKYAQDLSAIDCGSIYVPAFEHPDIWEGHASMIEEAAKQMGTKPSAVVTSVGGGGLLNGVVLGMRAVGWDDVPLMAMETKGANCFNAAIQAGEVVKLDAITSIAKSLGSLEVSPTTLEYYKQGKPPIVSQVISDTEAAGACLRFAEDHRFLVEPACGASLAAVYSNHLSARHSQGCIGDLNSVLVIVCGGAIVSTDVMESWKTVKTI